jgi:hypothetical protein
MSGRFAVREKLTYMFLGDNEVVLRTSWIYAIESHKSVVLWNRLKLRANCCSKETVSYLISNFEPIFY